MAQQNDRYYKLVAASVWIARLYQAQQIHDVAAASSAVRQLAELGFSEKPLRSMWEHPNHTVLMGRYVKRRLAQVMKENIASKVEEAHDLATF